MATEAVADLVFSPDERNKTLAYMGGGALLGLLLLPRVPVVGPFMGFVAAPVGMIGGVALRYGLVKKHISEEGFGPGRAAAVSRGAFATPPAAPAPSTDYGLRVVAGGAAVGRTSL